MDDNFSSFFSLFLFADSRILYEVTIRYRAMQPPSDSLSHQQHKINEFVVNGRTIRAPPPTYSAATTPALASTGHATYADDGEDDGEEYCSTPPPITIDIDASVKIEGNWNTAPSANNTIAPIVVNIVNALKHAEVIGDREDLRRRIDFKINASATYKGNSNKPCRPVQLVKKEASVDSIALCSQNDSQLEDRKRRANSVSCGIGFSHDISPRANQNFRNHWNQHNSRDNISSPVHFQRTQMV